MPRGCYTRSPETLAKLRADLKARWAADREQMVANAKRGAANAAARRPVRCPPRGTEEWRIFEKIRAQSNSATAHAYFKGA